MCWYHGVQVSHDQLDVLNQTLSTARGLKESGARPGQTVAIVGAGGGLGSLAQQYAKAMGLRVIAIDRSVCRSCHSFIIVLTSPSGEEKRKMSLEQLGAAEFVDFGTSKDLVADVKNATEDGQGPHAVILVAVNEKPFQQAAEVCFLSILWQKQHTDTMYSTSVHAALWSASVFLQAHISKLLCSNLSSG